MSDFETGAFDCKNDLADGWVPEVFSLDFLVHQLRLMMGASDAYIAGYLSTFYADR